jgi:hypothetical protein
MISEDDDLSGDNGTNPPEAAARSGGSRRRVAAGIAGLAVLGAGAYLVADGTRHHDTEPGKSTAITVATGSPAVTPASGSAAGPLSSATADAVHAPDLGTEPPRNAKEAAAEIAAARAAAAKDGYPVHRGFTPAPNAVQGPVTVTNTGSLRTGGTMRVVTARHDLSGQRELLWAADDGEPFGDARCTQNFHFSNNVKPRVRPTMLLCWRTSNQKSVVTVAVSRTGRPMKSLSVAEIDRQWAALG